MGAIGKFISGESGASAVEYGILIGAIGMAIAAGLTLFGDELSDTFSTAGGTIEQTVNQVEPAAGN
jgi:Flp pilus assembly pilin Flp